MEFHVSIHALLFLIQYIVHNGNVAQTWGCFCSRPRVSSVFWAG